MTAMHDVLHAIAIKKHGDAATLAALLGTETDEVTPMLERAVESGRIIEMEGCYMLTPAGHMILEGQYGARHQALRDDEAFVGAYEQFELINTELKQTITDWQVMEIGGKRVANDHSDAAYDEKIVDRISAIHERMEGVLKTFASRCERFARYAAKLETALERAEDGDRAWVSDATIESYHTVWFEMHEDLLRLLDRQRDE